MKYEIGDKVRNGAGNLCSVQKSCLQCKTLVGDEGKGYAKCCIQRSCPGWKDRPIIKRTFLDDLNDAIKFARIDHSGSLTGLLIARGLYLEHNKI